MRALPVQPLTAQAFAPFGQVIEKTNAEHFPINLGKCERYHDLCCIDLLGDDAKPMISLFQGTYYSPPIQLNLVERHPLGSQAFFPLGAQPYLVVVCKDEGGTPGTPHVFLAQGNQGVNYPAGQWHGVLTPLKHDQDFIVIDRGGTGNNLEEHHFDAPWIISLDPSTMDAE